MKRYLSLLLCTLLICGLFSGCGAASMKTEAAYDMVAGAPAEEFYGSMEAPAAMAESANGAMLMEEAGSTSTALPESRKWIINVYISAETDDLDAMTVALDEKINSLGGYVEDQSVFNGSAYNNRRYRNANLVIRIPAQDVDKFTEDVAGISNVVSNEKHLEDVTLQYVATESRVEALETEQTRLLELLAQAENMTDLLEIEGRLTDVRYELENYASQLRLYDNQIDYATINLNISEVQEYTPIEEPTLWERISGGFKDSISGLGESLQDLLVFVVKAAPYVLAYGAIILVIGILVRKLNKKRKERRAERKAAREAKKAAKKAAKEAAKAAKKAVIEENNEP